MSSKLPHDELLNPSENPLSLGTPKVPRGAPKDLFKTFLILLYAGAFYLPLHVFLSRRGGLAFLQDLSLADSLKVMFPLLGLLAFTLVTWQVLITTNLRWLRKLWPNILTWHKFQGLFALLFALLHPLFILAGYGLAATLGYEFVSNRQKPYLIPAYVALFTLLLTVITAALVNWRGINLPIWRQIHRLNYLVFVLAWIHSWFIGSDIAEPVLRAVWIAYLLAVIVSTIGRYRSTIRAASPD